MRTLVFLATALGAAALLPAAAPRRHRQRAARVSMIGNLFGGGGDKSAPKKAAATTALAEVTDTVYLDLSLLSKSKVNRWPLGRIKIGLYGNACPEAVARFLKCVDEELYEETDFYRIFADFSAQAGAYKGGTEEPVTYPSNDFRMDEPGYLAMANRGDEFFVTLGYGNADEFKDYSCIGHMVEGDTPLAEVNKQGSATGKAVEMVEISFMER